ncbi:Kelch repeat-containing protein [Sorangium sp. So ce385]|uniref:Kelch repeat-containing protein n=1 Tax=Sorangium sp. So ce385 TaxID=3133308 RepID=UPI003F5BBB1D
MPWLAAAPLVGGCGAEPDDTAAAALRLRFPEHADAVLSAREAFAPTAGGFRLASTEPGGTWLRAARPEVELPRDGSGAIRFRLAKGGEIRVRELGAAGEGAMAERAVSYGRAGGTSFWASTDRGVEEWLLLEEGVAHGEAVAAWEVEGALLRERGAAVELLDEQSGAPVLRVTAPRAYAATGRPVTVALRARGARIELSADAGGEAALVDPAWEPTSRMNVARWQGSTATLLLPSGKVLVAGGSDVIGVETSSAELYEPTTDTWTLAASMRSTHRAHTATLLEDGKVLVVGGGHMRRISAGSGGYEAVTVDAVELYELTTDRWTDGASMAESRLEHTATLLKNGKVLVAGGKRGTRVLSSAELYDPATDTWTTAAPMNAARSTHAALLLPSGEVLVAGGFVYDAPAGSTELYDPVADSWTLTGSMTEGEWVPVALAQLPSGGVLAAGRLGAERYDSAAGTWTRTSPMIAHQGVYSATTLHNGTVMVVGESTNVDDPSARTVELYDPEADTWTLTASTSGSYSDHTATRLLDGGVLLVGSSEYSERYSIIAAACASDADCGHTACVDGVCCESRCSEPCHSCAMPSSLGRCVLQPKGSDARDECAREGCDGACDGLGACSAVPKDGVCAPTQCRDETHSMEQVLCPADGASCADPSSEARGVVDCAPYDCDQASGACKVECSSLKDCAPGHVCDFSGRCVPPPPAANPGCGVAPAVAAAAGASRAGLGAAFLALLAVAARRSSAFRGKHAMRRGGS